LIILKKVLGGNEIKDGKIGSWIKNLAKSGLIQYLMKRIVILFIVILVAVYITIFIANMGGYVDEIIKSDLYMSISMKFKSNPQYSSLPRSKLMELIDAEFQNEIKRMGLDQPFLIRSFIYLWNSLTLNLGRAMFMTSDSGSRLVRNIILERLPQTILLFTTATVINFLIHLFAGLYLSRKYGSFLDKLVLYLAPTSSIPGWFYGIFLIMIFYSWLHVLPPGGMVDYPPPVEPALYFLSVLKHMVLPISAWVIGSLFLGIYSNRTFFLIFSMEDHVEVAKAKGLHPRDIERKYILRPTLPPIITNFALSVIASWTGAIITESVFNWPGLGSVAYTAIQYPDTPVIIGINVIYAYLLAFTVLILDFIYGLLDPRIKVGGGR